MSAGISKVAEELKDLARKISELAGSHSAFNIVYPQVGVLTSHIGTVARICELQEEAKTARTYFDDPNVTHREPSAFTCDHCDFGSGQRGTDSCGKCGGTGSVFRVGARRYPNTRAGYIAASEHLYSLRGI